jgi:hypothetical protein
MINVAENLPTAGMDAAKPPTEGFFIISKRESTLELQCVYVYIIKYREICGDCIGIIFVQLEGKQYRLIS